MATIKKQTSSADVNGHYKRTRPSEVQQAAEQPTPPMQPAEHPQNGGTSVQQAQQQTEQQTAAVQPPQPQPTLQGNAVLQGEAVRTPFVDGGNSAAAPQDGTQPKTEQTAAPQQMQGAAAPSQAPQQDSGAKPVPNGRYLRKDGKKGLSLFAVDDNAPDTATAAPEASNTSNETDAQSAPGTVIDKPIRTPDAKQANAVAAASATPAQPQAQTQTEPGTNSVAKLEASQKELNAKVDERDKTNSQRRSEIGDALKRYSDAFNDPNTSAADKKKIAREANKLFGEFEATDDKNITDRNAVTQTETLKGANGENLGELKPNADGTATVKAEDGSGKKDVTVGKDGTPLVKFKDQLYEFKDILDMPEFSVYHHAGDLARQQQAAEAADTPEGKKKERRKKAVTALAALADVLGAMGNMFFTTKGAKPVRNTNFSGVVSAHKAAEEAKLAERAKYWEERIKAADKSDAEMTKLINSTNMKAYLTKMERAFKERLANMRYNNMQKQTEAKRDAAIAVQREKTQAAKEAAETKYQHQRDLNRQKHEYSSAQIAQRGKEARSTADRRASNTLKGRKEYADYRHQKGYDKGISLFGK